MLKNLNIKNKRVAIILLNLGGPNNLESVKPFLFNLFYDKAIINLSNPFRLLLAKFIAQIRYKKSQQLYSLIGGCSPILVQTELQRLAIFNKLKELVNFNFEIFISMRYSYPNIHDILLNIIKYDPTEIILLPLYPQFSSVTTGSSTKECIKIFNKKNLQIPIKTICCYPIDHNFITAHVSIIRESLIKLKKNNNNFRILFSAHSLPKKIILSGDPYQWQVEQTVKTIISLLNINKLDYKIVYQSKIGPIKWLEPNISEEVKRAGIEKKALIIVPITFVSEHVETLVELDIEYYNIANQYQIEYIRVPTLKTHEIFIQSLSNIIINLVKQDFNTKTTSGIQKRICPQNFSQCPCYCK